MEIPEFVDQKSTATFARVCRLIAAHPELFAAQGTVVTSWRRYRGRTLGPYFRLAYRADGRQRSIFLGRSPKLAEAVRALLGAVQRPARDKRTLARLRKSAQAALVQCKGDLRRELGTRGLVLKGLEVRGWRRPGRRETRRNLGARM